MSTANAAATVERYQPQAEAEREPRTAPTDAPAVQAAAPEPDTRVASGSPEPDSELRCTLCGLRACWTS